MQLTKAWTVIDKLWIIWKSNLTDRIKRSYFQAAVVSILLYGRTIWMLTKRLEKKLDGKYTRMLRAILNKSWRQHPIKHQLHRPLPPITKTIQVTRTRHAGHCWRSRDDLISDVLRWAPTYCRTKAGWPSRTYIQQLCEDTGSSPEDLPEARSDREKWRERESRISVQVARHDVEWHPGKLPEWGLQEGNWRATEEFPPIQSTNVSQTSLPAVTLGLFSKELLGVKWRAGWVLSVKYLQYGRRY